MCRSIELIKLKQKPSAKSLKIFSIGQDTLISGTHPEALFFIGGYKGLSINVDFVFHYLLLELNVSIACRYVGGGWGKQVEFLQIPAQDANLLFG